SEDAFDALARHVGAREVVELLMVIGQYMMLARVMATTEIDLDEPVDPRAPRESQLDPRIPIEPGATREEDFVVEGRLLTDVGGTLRVPVLSTPGMIGKMERNAALLARAELPENLGTVGFEVRVKHVAAAREGARCTVAARLTRVVDERRLRFDVQA